MGYTITRGKANKSIVGPLRASLCGGKYLVRGEMYHIVVMCSYMNRLGLV